MKYIPSFDEFINCILGMHEWYYGSFASPVWGRSERRCLNCNKRQYDHYDEKKKKWIWKTYKEKKHNETLASQQ